MSAVTLTAKHPLPLVVGTGIDRIDPPTDDRGFVFAESVTYSSATVTVTADGSSLARTGRGDRALPYEAGLAAAMAKQLRAGIVHPCEIYAERDPER